MLWRPCAEANVYYIYIYIFLKNPSSSLAHVEWCFNYLKWNDNHPSHPRMKQIKKGYTEVTSILFFLISVLHSVAFPPLYLSTISLSKFGRSASVSQTAIKLKHTKGWLEKTGVWAICVFSLFADRRLSCCTSLAMLHNECVHTKTGTPPSPCSWPSLLRLSIWCSQCCCALIERCLEHRCQLKTSVEVNNLVCFVKSACFCRTQVSQRLTSLLLVFHHRRDSSTAVPYD